VNSVLAGLCSAAGLDLSMLVELEFYEWPLLGLVFSIGTTPNVNLWIDSQACYPNSVMQLLIM